MVAIGGIVSEIIIILAIAVVLFVLLKITKLFVKLVIGLIVNSILGVVVIILLNYFFKLGIQLSAKLLIPIALFGLPGAGTVVLIKLLGIAV